MKHDPPQSDVRSAPRRTALLLSIALGNTLLFAFAGWLLGGPTTAVIVGGGAFVLTGAALGMVAGSARNRR